MWHLSVCVCDDFVSINCNISDRAGSTYISPRAFNFFVVLVEPWMALNCHSNAFEYAHNDDQDNEFQLFCVLTLQSSAESCNIKPTNSCMWSDNYQLNLNNRENIFCQVDTLLSRVRVEFQPNQQPQGLTRTVRYCTCARCNHFFLSSYRQSNGDINIILNSLKICCICDRWWFFVSLLLLLFSFTDFAFGQDIVSDWVSVSLLWCMRARCYFPQSYITHHGVKSKNIKRKKRNGHSKFQRQHTNTSECAELNKKKKKTKKLKLFRLSIVDRSKQYFLWFLLFTIHCDEWLIFEKK